MNAVFNERGLFVRSLMFKNRKMFKNIQGLAWLHASQRNQMLGLTPSPPLA